MDRNYNIKIYPAAERDLLKIIEYLNTLSQKVALNYYDELTKQIASLSSMPERCPHPKDLALISKGYRYLIIRDYLVFYKAIGGTVEIHRSLYGRRNYQALL